MLPNTTSNVIIQMQLPMLDKAEWKKQQQRKNDLQKLKQEACTCIPDCGYNPLIKPDWFNAKMFEHGRKMCCQQFCSLFFAHLIGLLSLVYYVPILRTLLTTGKSANVSCLLNRYLQTALKIREWYEKDIWDPESSGFKSLQQVNI